MDLILWRHAQAVDAQPGQNDLDRVLTPHGEQQARHIAQWLQRHLPADARILVSPARRTQQTAFALGRAIETSQALAPDRSADELLAAASWPGGRGIVVAVGHQPTMGQVAARVLTGTERLWHVDKGAVWWMRREGGDQVMLLAALGPDFL